MTFGELKEVGRSCCLFGKPFAFVALPGCENFEAFGMGKSYDDSALLTFLPFGIWPKAGTILAKMSVEQLLAEPSCEEMHIPAHPIEQTRSSYLASVGKLINLLKANGGKVVYAKVKGITSATSPFDAAERYFNALPSTLRYIAFLPGFGLWIGATPELILNKSSEMSFESFALAGSSRSTNETIGWDEKNKVEHAYVLDPIVATFRGNGLNCEVSEPGNIYFGPIAHLAHKIKADGYALFDDLMHVISPTPAIAGFPIDRSINLIKMFETSERYLYGGEIILKSPSSEVAYLNLRCATVYRKPSTDQFTYLIYSGGGITADSVASDEWIEAELKAKPFVDAINN